MRPLELLAKICLIAACAAFLCLLAYCIAGRIGYPFELEWLEGDMLLAAVRLLEHKPLYTAPAAEYVPGIYPPFYYAVTAGAFRLFGPSLPVLRCISVFGLLVIFAVICAVVYRETRTGWLAFLGAGMLASFYDFHGSWYDIGRIDSFFYCLLLLTLCLAARADRSAGAAAVAALAWCLSFYTKQSSGIYLPFIMLYLLLRNRKSLLVFTASAGLLSGAVLLYLQHASGGWFAQLTIFNPLAFPRDLTMAEVAENIARSLPVFLAAAGAGAALTVARSRSLGDITIWELTLIPSIIAVFRIRTVMGSHVNDVMYLTIWLSILIPLWLHRFVIGQPTQRRAWLSPLIMALLTAQLALLAYPPRKWLPEPGSAARGSELIDELRAAPGPVLVLRHPVYAWMAGKEPFLHFCNLWAYRLSGEPYRARDLHEKIKKGYFSLIVIDDYDYGHFGENHAGVKQFYNLKRHIDYSNCKQFSSVAGYLTKPTDVFIPKK